MQQDQFSCTVEPAALNSLKYIAAGLPKEPLIPRDEIEDLRKLCDELRREIRDCETINKTLKAWLLDLVRMMREGIDRFTIRGTKGLRSELHEILGSIIDHYQDGDVAEVEAKAPGLWKNLMTGVGKVGKLAKTAVPILTFVESARKALGYTSAAE